MDKNLALQFTGVAVILLSALVWIVLKMVKLRKKSSESPCCGCSISDNCNKKELKTKSKEINHDCEESPNHVSSTDKN